MPLEKIEFSQTRAWGLWRITESEDSLLAEVKEHETIPDQISHPQKRLEFITGRVLAKMLIEKLGNSFEGITKDEFGKPFYKSHSVHLSLSHSYPYVAALADHTKSVGIDVEQVKSKLIKIAPRILHATELKDAGEDETKHCIYWCGKEAMIKVYGKKDLIFAEQLLIAPFQHEKKGYLTGSILVNKEETILPLYYEVMEGFVIVFNA